MPILNPLDLLGWGGADPKLGQVFDSNKKVIVLFPHTSVMDGVLAYYYLHFDSEIKKYRDRMRILVREDNFKIPGVNLLLNYIKAVSVGKPGSGSGSLNTTFKELDELDDFILCLSPKGRLTKGGWRSGWYHIAKRYNATVIVAGTDYEKHRMLLAGEPIKVTDQPIEEIQPRLVSYMGELLQLNPGREIVEDRPHTQRGIIDANTKIFYILVIVLIIVVSFIAVWYSRTPKEPKASSNYTQKFPPKRNLS